MPSDERRQDRSSMPSAWVLARGALQDDDAKAAFTSSPRPPSSRLRRSLSAVFRMNLDVGARPARDRTCGGGPTTTFAQTPGRAFANTSVGHRRTRPAVPVRRLGARGERQATGRRNPTRWVPGNRHVSSSSRTLWCRKTGCETRDLYDDTVADSGVPNSRASPAITQSFMAAS